MEMKQINQLRKQLQIRLSELEKQLAGKELPDSTELSAYDNHPADNASDLTNKLTEMVIDGHYEDEIEKIQVALQAIEAGTYGNCTVCGDSIPFERLEAVPTALTCVEHAESKVNQDVRPVEEGVISAAFPSIDFDMDAQFSSSDTPSDKM